MAELPSTLVKKKNAKSVVWVYFGLTEKGVLVPGEEHRPVCRTSKKAVMCKRGNTTNLFVHLQDAHPNLHRGNIRLRRTSIRERARGNSAYTHYRHRKGKAVQPKELASSPGTRSFGHVLYCKRYTVLFHRLESRL